MLTLFQAAWRIIKNTLTRVKCRLLTRGLSDACQQESLDTPDQNEETKDGDGDVRCELAGSSGSLVPIILQLTEASFIKAGYVALGYTEYDVICIGAAGGRGANVAIVHGWTIEYDAWPDYYFFGAAGGGGGMHRVQGNLSELPDVCPVEIGVPGLPGGINGDLGTVTANSPGLLSVLIDEARAAIAFRPGSSGGPTSFNEDLCVASGGTGGKPLFTIAGAGPSAAPEYSAPTADLNGKGGNGGSGNTDVAGGGGVGGTTNLSGSAASPNGADGGYDGQIGEGGGGGAGGLRVVYPTPVTLFLASFGGRGSYSLSDTSVYGPGGPNSDVNAQPGAGGGAKATPITRLPTVFGANTPGADPDGAVFIRLT